MFAHDDDGRLYDEAFRATVGTGLTDNQLAGVEALLALRRAASYLDRFSQALRNAYGGGGDLRMRVLSRLRGRLDGELFDDLVRDYGEEVEAMLADAERAGMLTREDGLPQRIRLSALGVERMNQVMRAVADNLSALIDGLTPDQLADLRHTCLQLIANHADRAPRPD